MQTCILFLALVVATAFGTVLSPASLVEQEASVTDAISPMDAAVLAKVFTSEGGCDNLHTDKGNYFAKYKRWGYTCLGVTPEDGWGNKKYFSGCGKCTDPVLFVKCCHDTLGRPKFREHVQQLYVAEYFKGGGCTGLTWPAYYVCCDVAVNEGVGRSARYVKATTKDTDSVKRCLAMNALSLEHYNQIGGPNLQGWRNRAADRKKVCNQGHKTFPGQPSASQKSSPASKKSSSAKPKSSIAKPKSSTDDKKKPCAKTLKEVASGTAILKPSCCGGGVLELGKLFGVSGNCYTAPIVAAVKRFQTLHRLKPPPGEDGWVGATTLKLITQIHDKVPNHKNLPCAKDAKSVMAKQGLLKPGCCTPLVDAVQKLLKVTGEKCFGAKTQAAVISYQMANKLTPPVGEEGWIGDTTYHKLDPKGSGAPASTKSKTKPNSANSKSKPKPNTANSKSKPKPKSANGQCSVGKWGDVAKNKKIILATAHVSQVRDQATPNIQVPAAAAGKKAQRSHYENAPGGSVCLSTKVADFLIGLASNAKTQSFSISEIAGGSHSAGSLHYSGVAVDLNRFNGQILNKASSGAQVIIAVCRQFKAKHIFHSSLNCGPVCVAHNDHVHCDF